MIVLVYESHMSVSYYILPPVVVSLTLRGIAAKWDEISVTSGPTQRRAPDG